MTRAASNRKNGAGTTAASSRPGPVFRGRDVVFVDPLDDKESYWWPAMIVPVPEIDSSMDCTALNPGECLVKYFEDNKYSVVPFTDLQPFVPTTIPFLEFELAAGQKFLKNGGVVNAMAYLESGKVKRKFSWHRWGTAQEQELSLDSHKHKAINLPLVSDKDFAELSIQQQPHIGIFSSASSSPATSTKHDTDTENDNHDSSSSKVNGAQSAASAATPKSTAFEGAGEQPASSSGAVAASTAVGSTTARQSGHQLLKNGLQRSLAGVASSAPAQSASTLLPSPVSLHDLTTEPADETEFGLRSSKARGEVTKGSPAVASVTGRRSRRGSRDNEGKGNTAAAPTPASKETTRRSRNTSEVSSSSASSTSGHNSSNGAVAAVTAPTTSSPQPTPSSSSPSISTTAAAAPNTESPKKRKKTIMEIPMLTDSQNGVTEARPISGRSSREGSAEPTVSPRSTRHSSRKATDKRSGSVSDDTYEPAVENAERAGHAMTRMTRQRSAPKSASSLPGPDSSVLGSEKTDTAVNETEGDQEVKGEKETDAVMAVEAESDLKMETEEAENKTIAEAAAMDVDVPEPTGPSKSTETKRSSQEEEQGQGTPSIPPSLSLVSAAAAASASSSPSSSSGPESEQATEDNVASAMNNGLLQSLERERQEMSRNFEHVLPTLAIGSKEREAFYENCMDHLQRLRQEHRRLKDILKSSEYLPKGRRATRSSPQYHPHHHRHHQHQHHHHNQQHLEEKPNHRGRSSPAPLRNNSQSSDGSNGNKENTQSNGTHKGYSKAEARAEAAKTEAAAKAKAEATAAAAALATEGNGGDAKTRSASTPASSTMYQGSTPSSAILTSNIATTTRRSAATAAAAAVAAAVTRPSRQAQSSSNASKGAGPKGSKKRSHSAAASSSPAATSVSAAMAAEVEAAALAAVSEDGGGPITTRAKRRQR